MWSLQVALGVQRRAVEHALVVVWDFRYQRDKEARAVRNSRWLALFSVLWLLWASGCQPDEKGSVPSGGSAQAESSEQAGSTLASQTQVRGRLETIGEGEDAIDVIYLEGSPYQMGYTHGKLTAEKVRKFYSNIILAMCVAMKVPVQALDEAWQAMEPFVAADLKEEMRGLADGAGVELKMVQRAHAIPDLSEFHCTFFASWGKATSNGHLIQIRALDYATAAGIQNCPAIIVYKPDGKIPFVTVGWAGFIGCVTGISGKSIAVSEIGTNVGDEKETLEGEPFPFLLRRVLSDALTLDDAVRIIQDAKRTSSYLYCVGDGKIPSARAFLTCKDWAYVFDPKSLPNRKLDDTVYFSMGHNSPWNEKLYDVLKSKMGQIDEKVAMEDVMRGLGTGDLHAVAWDVTHLKMWVANCTSAPLGTTGKPAYGETFVPFDVAKALGVVPEQATPPAAMEGEAQTQTDKK